MRRWSPLLFLPLLLFLCLLMSCSTTKTEYVYVKTDISDVVEPVLAQRPDNSVLKINNDQILQLVDVIENSEQYMYAWEMWENYAVLLEDTLVSVKDRLADDTGSPLEN